MGMEGFRPQVPVQEKKITESQIKNTENIEKREDLYEATLRSKQEGAEAFDALFRDGGEEAINRKKRELFDHPADPSGKKIEGLNTSQENLQEFSSDAKIVADMSPAQLKEIYSHGYGDQRNIKYVGNLLVAINGTAFAQGFLSAYLDKRDNKKTEINVENLKPYIDLANKILEIEKEISLKN